MKRKRGGAMKSRGSGATKKKGCGTLLLGIICFLLLFSCFQDKEPSYVDRNQQYQLKQEKAIEENPEREAKKQKVMEAAIEQGFDSLQALFICVDDTYSVEEIDLMAWQLNLIANEREDEGIDGMYLEVATKPGERGEGLEEWYKYEVDHASFSFSRSGGSHIISKSYYAQEQLVTVTQRFSNGEISTKNDIAGHFVSRIPEYIKDYTTIEEALLYAINYKY